MPNFQFPPGAGGGGGGGSSPVQGGSGSFYGSIASAQLGEVEDVVAVFTAQAGTVAGFVTGTAALSAVDDFYNDYFLIDEDTTPTTGLQCRIARVVDYDGTTKVLTLDKPWNFVGETSLRLVRPIRINLLADLTESPTFTKNVILSLAGHRLQGQIDQTTGSLLWIHGGDGYITDGVQKTNIGVLWIDGCTVSVRRGTIYAVLLTSGSNLGRCILNRCNFSGVVAGRRGRVGWEISGCRNYGLPEGSPADRNIPYRLVESVAGVAVVVTQASWDIDGEWSGAAFYSENSITGATAQIEGQMKIKIPATLTRTITGEQPSYAFLFCAVGGATLTMTFSSNPFSIMDVLGSNEDSSSSSTPLDIRASAGFLMTVDFTGTANINGSGTTTNGLVRFNGAANFAEILVIGTATTTGSITTASLSAFWSLPRYSWSKVNLQSVVSGTISAGATNTISYAGRCFMIVNSIPTQSTGTPSITASGIQTLFDVGHYGSFDVGNVTTGTWTVSATIVGAAQNVQIFFLVSSVTAGTFVVSGSIRIDLINTGSFFTLIFSAPAGPTMTFSSAITIKGGNTAGLTCGGAGTVTLSGTVILEGILTDATTAFINGTAMTISGPWSLINMTFTAAIVFIQNASGTLTFSNTFTMSGTKFNGSLTFFNSPGGGLTWPPTISINDCVFLSTITGLASGVSTTSMTFRNCVLTGLITFTGDRFLLLEAFDTSFQGNSANESINASGTRPATYRLWKCITRALVGDLFPEIIDDYVTIAASGALTAGEIMSINATPQAIANTAATQPEGVLLITTTGAGEPAIIVKRGTMDVMSRTAAPAVAAGDNCVVEIGTPTQQRQGATTAGSRISRALEAAGARVAGKAYSIVNLM